MDQKEVVLDAGVNGASDSSRRSSSSNRDKSSNMASSFFTESKPAMPMLNNTATGGICGSCVITSS